MRITKILLLIIILAGFVSAESAMAKIGVGVGLALRKVDES